MCLWVGSNSWLFIAQFWRRKKKQLQTLAAEPCAGLRPKRGKILPWLHQPKLHPSEKSPRSRDTSVFARITPGFKLAWCFYTKSPMVSHRRVSPFPALGLGSGLLKKRKKESGFPCWVNIAALRRHSSTRSALGRLLTAHRAETGRVSSLRSKSSVTRGREAVEMLTRCWWLTRSLQI